MQGGGGGPQSPPAAVRWRVAPCSESGGQPPLPGPVPAQPSEGGSALPTPAERLLLSI